MQSTITSLTHRDRAVLEAVAAGRCQLSAECSGALVVDGKCVSDQFVVLRLTAADLITTNTGQVQLTPAGQALLATECAA